MTSLTAVQDLTVPLTPAAQPTAPPLVRDVIVRVAVSLATALIVPAVLFTSTMLLFNVPTAMVVALTWMGGAMSFRWATARPVSGLLVLSVGIMAVKTTFALVTGNTFVYFVQPVFVDAAVATVFLGSLWSARPIVARLAPDFYPMDAATAARPRIRGLFWRLTLMWGLVILVKGTITLWLLESLSTVDFVLIKGGVIITLTLLTVVATVAWSLVVGHREGLLHPQPQPGQTPAAVTIASVRKPASRPSRTPR